MISNDPNRRLLNFIYQTMEDERISKLRQALQAAQPGQAKAELLIQEILDDLNKRRLQADLDSQNKEEEKQKRILKHQRFRRYVYKHANDYAHKHANEMWDRYQTDEEFRKRTNERIKRGLAALDKAYARLKGMAVSETTGSPIADHPVNVSWSSDGKYTSGPEFS